MPNGLTSFLTAYQAGDEIADRTRENRQNAQVRSLAPAVVSGDPQAYAQAAAINPQAAGQFQQANSQILQRARGAATYLRQALASGNPQQIAAGRQAIKPFMDTLKPGTSYPLDRDPAEELPQIDAFLAQTTNLGGNGNTVQSQKIGEDGFIYNTYRDGRIENTGVKADPRTQLRDQAGIAPSIVNLRTGVAAPLSEAGQPAAAPAQGVYIDPSIPPEIQSQIRASEASGQPYTGQGLVAARPDSSQIITPYQQAQLANAQADNARADAALGIQAQAAQAAQAARSDAASARQQASQLKAQQAQQAIQTRQAALSDVQRGAARVRAALENLDQGMVGTGPITAAALRLTPAGQELETAVNAMNNSMLSLTRVPGMGAQSDLEARIASMRFPQLDRDSGVNARTVEGLDAFIRDLSGTARASDAQDRQSAGSDTTPGRSIIRTGTLNGRRVVQYSDGTTDYAD